MQPLIGYETEYLISKDGYIYRIGSCKPLSPALNKQNGYLYVSLWKNGVGKTYSVHRLVAQQFIANVDNKPEVNHKDSNRANPHFSNLEWCTSSENNQHGYDFGFMSQEHRKRFKDFELELLLDSFLSGVTITQIAATVMCGLSNLSIDLKRTAKRLNKIIEYNAELVKQKNTRNAAVTLQQRVPVKMYSLDGVYLKTFDSLSDATRYLGKTSSGTIANALNPTKKQKAGYGYLWTYV